LHRLARTRPCSGATPNARSAALLSSMEHRHAVSLAAASRSGPQQAAAGAAVDVELRYPAHGSSFAAHDGIAPEPDVPCACADGASARYRQATATAARRWAALCCIVCSVQLGE